MLVTGARSSEEALLVLNPGGRLCATPAYCQTSSDNAVQLDSADDWIATKLIPEVDMKISSFSRYVTALAAEGNGTVCVYSNSTAPEPNGDLNGGETKAHEDQTDSSTPLTVSATSNDGGGANDEWKAFDGDDTTYWRSGADPATTAQDLEIDFGAGSEKRVNKLIIVAANEASADSRCFPKTFTIQGHNGTSYSTLSTVSSSTDPGDQGKQVYTWTSSTEFQKLKINITDNHGTGAFVCVGEMKWVEAQDEDAPGTLLATLEDEAGSGDTADTWTHFSIASASQYQLARNTTYWIVLKGAASKDWSESTRRWNTNTGSMFPDSMPESKYTANGGTTWSQCQQNSKPALWNMMINAVEAASGKPVPRLCYGRYNGKYLFIAGAGIREIPEAGILLDMSDHSSPDSKFGYHVWLNNESGTLTLTATTDAIDDTDGIKHKSGASGYRHLGDVYPIAIHTGHYGPVDVMDRRLNINHFNKINKTFGKLNPFDSATLFNATNEYDQHFVSPNDNDDFLVEALLTGVFVNLEAHFMGSSNLGKAVSIGLNGKVPLTDIQGGSYWGYTPCIPRLAKKISTGYSKIWPLLACGNTGNAGWRLWADNSVQSKVIGTIEC